MHDARLLTCPSLFQKICTGEKISNKTKRLRDDIGKINFSTIGDSASPLLESLIKKNNEQSRDPNKQLFNKKLCNASVVRENAYRMLKTKWQIDQTSFYN